MKLWRVVIERKRSGAEKRDRSATLAVAAADLQECFDVAAAFLGTLAAEAPVWRIVSAMPSKGAVEILDGHRDLTGSEAGTYPTTDE